MMTPIKYPQNLHTPKKYLFFWKPKKNIEIQNFEPPKNYPSLRTYEDIRVPPWGGTTTLDWTAADANVESLN